MSEPSHKFEVKVLKTPLADRLGISNEPALAVIRQSRFTLCYGHGERSGRKNWELTQIRQFGASSKVFQLNSGTRAESGEGVIKLKTKQASQMHSLFKRKLLELADEFALPTNAAGTGTRPENTYTCAGAACADAAEFNDTDNGYYELEGASAAQERRVPKFRNDEPPGYRRLSPENSKDLSDDKLYAQVDWEKKHNLAQMPRSVSAEDVNNDDHNDLPPALPNQANRASALTGDGQTRLSNERPDVVLSANVRSTQGGTVPIDIQSMEIIDISDDDTKCCCKGKKKKKQKPSSRHDETAIYRIADELRTQPTNRHGPSYEGLRFDGDESKARAKDNANGEDSDTYYS